MAKPSSGEKPAYQILKIQVTPDDLAVLAEWGQGVFRTPAGQASFLVKELLANRRQGARGNGAALPPPGTIIRPRKAIDGFVDANALLESADD